MACTTRGTSRPTAGRSGKAARPRTMAATRVTSKDSNRSAAMPAQSPTLSPTLSAMVAACAGGGRLCGLADRVGPDVGRLGEDAPADPHEHGQQGRPEAEAEQHA